MQTLESTQTVNHMTNQVPYGPLLEAAEINAGLDYYKPTMSQHAYEQEPDAEVTFTFKNRGQQRLLDYIDPTALQQRFEEIRERGFSEHELNYYASLKRSNGERMFSDDYIDTIRFVPLPHVNVKYDTEKDDIALETTGHWVTATFWETVVMSEINEAYFESYLLKHGLNPLEVYEEGDRRLSEKVAILQANPDIKISDFGTRRHFSLRWQKHVVERLQAECPENLVGTSNVALADSLGLKPIGTFAHEMPMVFAGIAQARGLDIRASHGKFLDSWYEHYGQDSSIALTDTFGSHFFFEDFTPEQAQSWKGLRHDSGDPIEFAERAIEFYKQNGIDPTTKTIVFSDGLDIGQIVKLHEYFKGRVQVMFGWGTTLTNDLGIKPLNVVMKATHVKLADGREADTVKLSDDAGKHTGPDKLVKYYNRKVFNSRRPSFFDELLRKA